MSRVVLVPFSRYQTQLTDESRLLADSNLKDAMEVAHQGAATLISLGNVLEESAKDEFPEILRKISKIINGAVIRVKQGYAWLMLATLKVSSVIVHGTLKCNGKGHLPTCGCLNLHRVPNYHAWLHLF